MGQPQPQGNAIRALSFAGTQGYAGGDFGMLLHTSDAGATWTGLLSTAVRDVPRAGRTTGPLSTRGGACDPPAAGYTPETLTGA